MSSAPSGSTSRSSPRKRAATGTSCSPPGCVTAGRSLDEAAAFAEEALALHIHGLREDGDAPRRRRTSKT